MYPCGCEEWNAEGARIPHCSECGHGQVRCGLCGESHMTSRGLADQRRYADDVQKEIERPWHTLQELRDDGWMVAVHNDYRLNGKTMTFWLFTHTDGRWIKGEGATDSEALAQALASRPVKEEATA